MPQDRSLLSQLRESLTPKEVRRYFPNPADPKDPDGNTARLGELIDSALWWLGRADPIELEDSTLMIPANGRLYLGSESTSKIRKVTSIEQGDEVFEEARMDHSQGLGVFCGSWKVHRRYLYVLGLYSGHLPFVRSRGQVVVERALQAGPFVLRYYGIPEENDVIGVGTYRRAVIDYAMYLAINEILTKELRGKTIVDTEGIPEIRFNEKELRAEAQARLEAAHGVVGRSYVASL